MISLLTRELYFVILILDRINRFSQCPAKLNYLGGVNILHAAISSPLIFRCVSAYTFTKTISEVIYMKPEIKKIVTRSALFLGILAVSIAGMQLANLRNQQMHQMP